MAVPFVTFNIINQIETILSNTKMYQQIIDSNMRSKAKINYTTIENATQGSIYQKEILKLNNNEFFISLNIKYLYLDKRHQQCFKYEKVH